MNLFGINKEELFMVCKKFLWYFGYNSFENRIDLQK